MVGIIILCVIAAALGALLLMPIHVRAAYDQGDIRVRLQYGPVKLWAYPGEETAEGESEKQKKSRRKKKQAKDSEEREEAEKKKAGLKVNRSQILYSLKKLPPVLGKALRRTGRRITLKPLKVYLLVAGSDPADTAVLYGELEAALGAGLPAVHRLIRIQDQDIQLFLDFQQEEMDCIADVGVSIRIWDLLVIGLGAGAGLLKWLIGFRRLADPQPKENPAPDPRKTDEPGAA